jgi:lysophospholipase L1-like esterase
MTLSTANLVCDGNSITAGFIGEGVDLPQNVAWPVVLRGLFIADASATRAWSVKSVARSGNTTQQRIDEYDAAVRPQFAPVMGLNVLTFFEGLNTLLAGVSVDDAITQLKAYATTAMVQGWTLQLCTIPATTNVAAAPKVIQYNTWLRTTEARAYSSLPVLDLNADSRLATASNLTYFQTDGIHPTAAGYAVIADLVHTRLLGV